MPSIPAEWYEEPRPGVRRMRPPGVSFRWIDLVLDEVNDGTLDAVLEELQFPPEIAEIVTESRGESARRRHAGMTILRLELPAAVLIDSDEDYILSMVIAEDRLLTVRRLRLGVIEDACASIAETEEVTVSTLGAAVEIGDEFLDRLGPSLRRTADDLDEAEIEESRDRAARIDRIAAVRRVLLALDRHLDPLQTAIQRTLVDASSRANRADLDALRGLLERANWMEHRIHGQLDRARILSDRDHVMAMDDLATSTYRLSWIATIFLPLTFFTGLLGINVGGIPFATSTVGFWIVCGILAAVAFGTAVVLAIIVRSEKHTARDAFLDLIRREQDR